MDIVAILEGKNACETDSKLKQNTCKSLNIGELTPRGPTTESNAAKMEYII